MSQLSRGEILDRVAGGESLRGANLMRADLSSMDLSRADLTEANLRMADISGSELRDARLDGGFLSGARLNRSSLVGASLVQASMIGVLMKGADLSQADLSGADLTGASLEGALLVGAYLVGTFLNETDLTRANLSGAYVRMGQLAGSNLSSAILEQADLSSADLSGVRLDDASLLRTNLSGANISLSSLAGADLRGADLTDSNLSGCNLTGARLRGVKYEGIRLDDAWADWVEVGEGDKHERVALQEAFPGIIGIPIAQVLIDGRIDNLAWGVILAHMNDFLSTRTNRGEIRLKGINPGVNSSAMYLEGDTESSLAAYLLAFSDIMGRGSLEVFEKLSATVSDEGETGSNPANLFPDPESPLDFALSESTSPLSASLSAGLEALKQTTFWDREKAVVIITGDRRIWFEATSDDALTLRPPRGSYHGLDLIRGRFAAPESRKPAPQDIAAHQQT